jgi:hypothetical protein
MKPETNNIKPIQTEFKGILYRSRTEARWAVFMDYLNVEFEYEPEGFDLGVHGWYIPDFYLPQIDIFLEIKPSMIIHPSPTEEFAILTKKNIITFCGPPPDPNTLMDFNGGESGFFQTPYGSDFYYWFCVCPHCRRADIKFMGRADRINCNCPKSEHGDKGYNHNDPVLIDAYKESANAFRFSKRKNRLRTLYKFAALLGRPNATVLVTEGEKAADAAARLFPEAVVTTWQGGRFEYAKTDWTPLAGRTVILWPDADTAGVEAMQGVRDILWKLGCRVALPDLPSDLPLVFNAADVQDRQQALDILAGKSIKQNVCND